MKIKWLGHASFLITSAAGIRIITDPYQTKPGLDYGEINEAADIVTISHEHADHNHAAAVRGNPQVLRGTAEAKGISFRSIPVHHDSAGGTQRGKNTIFCFTVDGVKVCHLGDLGHALSDKQAAEVGEVDVLLAPVGGFFTVDAATASRIGEQLKARVIIPMHFRNSKCTFPISEVDEFLAGKQQVTRSESSEAEFRADELPASTQIIVLKPAL